LAVVPHIAGPVGRQDHEPLGNVAEREQDGVLQAGLVVVGVLEGVGDELADDRLGGIGVREVTGLLPQ
jgi:hypothetical protein